MGVFLYYLPGRSADTVTRKALADSPLADVFRDALVGDREFTERVQIRGVHARGPDRMNGVVVSLTGKDPASPQAIGVTPSQEWREIGQGAAKYWIGIDPQHPPTPDDLERPGMLDGYDVRLGNHTWHVPIVRRKGKYPTLPTTLSCDADGIFQMRLRREWEPVWEYSGKIWNQLFTEMTTPWQTVWALCIQMLGINYRLGAQEVAWLELLDTENFRDVYRAVVDWPQVEIMLREIVAENDTADPNGPAPDPAAGPGAANSTVGPEDSTPTTAPAEATSTS